MTSSTLAVVIAAVFGGGTLTVAILQAIIGRGQRKVDIADKVTEATDRIFSRYDRDFARLEERSTKCEVRLSVTERELAEARNETRRIKTTLRVMVKAVKSGDPAAIEMAVAASEELIA